MAPGSTIRPQSANHVDVSRPRSTSRPLWSRPTIASAKPGRDVDVEPRAGDRQSELAQLGHGVGEVSNVQEGLGRDAAPV